jgi:hypothetical protein
MQVFHLQVQIEVRLGQSNNPTRDALLNSDPLIARSHELTRQELGSVVARSVQGCLVIFEKLEHEPSVKEIESARCYKPAEK